VTLAGSSGSGAGAFLELKRGVNTAGYFTTASVIGGAASSDVAVYAASTNNVRIYAQAVQVAEFDASTTANDIRLKVYDHTAGGMVRVSRGASNSGGAGLRVLCVPN
jgi:hypothetical protein